MAIQVSYDGRQHSAASLSEVELYLWAGVIGSAAAVHDRHAVAVGGGAGCRGAGSRGARQPADGELGHAARGPGGDRLRDPAALAMGEYVIKCQFQSIALKDTYDYICY